MPPEPFVARFVIWRRALGVALALGFVALGLWIAGVFAVDGPREPAIGWITVAAFGFFALVGLRRLMLTGPAVRVDAQGIWVWRADGGVTIPWAAIRTIEEQRVQRQRFLCLTVDRPDLYRAKGLLGGANSAMGFGDAAVGVQGTDRRVDDLVAAIERFS